MYKKHLFTALLLMAAALFLRAGARYFAGFADSYARTFNRIWVMTLGRASSVFPFSVVEFLICGLIILLFFWIIRLILAWVHRKRESGKEKFMRAGRLFIGRVLVLVTLIFFLFEANEDIYFYCTPFSVREGYGEGDYSTEDLAKCCTWLADEAGRYADLVERDGGGIMVMNADADTRIREAMMDLGTSYGELSGWYPRAKPVFFSRIMSLTNMAGIYSAYTIEANYNRDMTEYNHAFCASHELSHLKGILQENEANFVAYLCCMNSKEPDIHYSGLLSGWIYCGNELYKRDRECWSEIYGTLDDRCIADLSANNAFWASYKGEISDAAESFNDAYLKGRGQEDGTESYDRVVDLIVSYEKKRGEVLQ